MKLMVVIFQSLTTISAKIPAPHHYDTRIRSDQPRNTCSTRGGT